MTLAAIVEFVAGGGDLDEAIGMTRGLSVDDLSAQAADMGAMIGGTGPQFWGAFRRHLEAVNPAVVEKRRREAHRNELMGTARHMLLAVRNGNISPNAVEPTMARFGLTYAEYKAEFGGGVTTSERLKSSLAEFTLAEMRAALTAVLDATDSHLHT